MKNRRWLLVLFSLLSGAALFPVAQTPAQAQALFKVGVMTKSYDDRRAKALEKFEEIIGKYIEDRASIKMRLRSMTYADLTRAVEKGEVDFIWGYGLVVSMELIRKLSLSPILTATLGEHKRALYKRMAVATKEIAPGLVDFSGFKGKRLTFVGDEQWSFELLVFKIWAAERFGVKDISQFLTLKGRDPDEGFFIPASKRGAIYSLFVREADIAVAHEFEYMTQEKLTPNAVRDRTEVLPVANPPEGYMEAPLFARKGVDKKDLDRLVKVLIEMPNDPEGRQILLSSKVSGFAKVTEADYQTVKALIAKKESLGIK